MAAQRGFTLIEMVITVAILALAAGVTIGALGGIGRAELRKNAGKIAGTLRATYDSAALEGRVYRLKFDLKKNSVDVEAAPELSLRSNALDVFGLGSLMAPPERKQLSNDEIESEKKSQQNKTEASLFGVLDLPDLDEEQRGTDDFDAKMGSFKSQGHTFILDEDVHIMDVWTAGRGKIIDEGSAYLYFFPMGATQDALIHLSDSDTEHPTLFTIKISALTGKTEILPNYIEAPK